MIYPATGWSEVVQYNDKHSATIENLVEQTCLCRYLCPAIITYVHGNELLGHTFKIDLIEVEYGIKTKWTTTENPQENSILEIIHQVIEHLVSRFDLKNNYLDKDEPQPLHYKACIVLRCRPSQSS